MRTLLIVNIIIALCLCALTRATPIDSVVEHQESDAVPVVRPEDINEDCILPKEIGRCFALFHRYAFNVEKGQCEEFIYGGCAGNANNYESLAECEAKCNSNKAATTAETPIESSSDQSTTSKNVE